jgi:hypothetical protein
MINCYTLNMVAVLVECSREEQQESVIQFLWSESVKAVKYMDKWQYSMTLSSSGREKFMDGWSGTEERK